MASFRNTISINKVNTGCAESTKIDKKLVDNLIQSGIINERDKLNHELLNSKLENYLQNEIRLGKPEAYFQLGHVLFEAERYDDSIYYYREGCEKFKDYQCMFQLGVIYYDGLGVQCDPELGCAYMKRIMENQTDPLASHLVFSAAYNLGRAYYQGYGVRQSDDDAERLWLFAADDGNPQASIMAQTALGFFYSTRDHFNVGKSFFWHSEACGNGSIESQACIGVMYLYGLGAPIDWEASLICLSNAAERGSIYAQGNLSYYFYKRKLYTKATDVASRLTQLEANDLSQLSNHSSIIIDEYLRKGVAIGCFIYARCLHLGRGVQADKSLANKYYSKCFSWDPELCADFQKLTQTNQL